MERNSPSGHPVVKFQGAVILKAKERERERERGREGEKGRERD